MTAVFWPSTLPQIARWSSFSETPLMASASFASDIGPPIERAKSTIRIVKIACVCRMNQDQLDTLADFVFSTLSQATAQFIMPHPRTGISVTARLDGSPPYTITSVNRVLFDVALQLMVIG